MGAAYKSFGIALREPEPGKTHDNDIIAFLDTLPSQKKSKWIKLAIREKLARDAKRSRKLN